MMPEYDGYEVCARLRELSDVPIVMLTAKSQSSDVTRGFAVGATDYVKKPFSNDELISRIESLLRRKKSTDASTNITKYSDGLLDVEFATQRVSLQGEEVAFTPTEFKLLAFLIRHPNKTISPRNLLAEVWGDAYSHDKALLSLYIHQLRQKLKEKETDHAYIKTHWGQGYWFNPLPQTPKSSPEALSAEPEVEPANEKEEKSSVRFFKSKWLWAATGALVGILAFILFQQNVFLAITTNRNGGSTTVEARMTAEGFRETEVSGLRGEICIENAGTFSTANLSVVNTVQAYSESTVRSFSGTVDLSQNPIIAPGNTSCYPYELTFESDSGQAVQYRMTTSITITNHIGLSAGSANCRGSRLCPFGPEIITDLILPEP
jgi:DNA-binding response OmpR family regulator